MECPILEVVLYRSLNMASGKTHKGIKKRIKRSSTGKLSHWGQGLRHLMSGRSGKLIRGRRRWGALSAGVTRTFKRQYGVE